MPPDHWSIKYMERIRIRSIETDESSKDPDPPSSVPPERPPNPPVGSGFKSLFHKLETYGGQCLQIPVFRDL